VETDACEIREAEGLALVLTCEHASERMPAPWEWPAADRWLVGTHWAYDIGAAELTRDLHAALGGTAVLSRFTRLLADANRPEDDPTLFRAEAEGHPIELNRELSADERAQRIERLWRPYHAAVDRALGPSSAPLVLAVHTFTPVYEGQLRELEVGVLFDREEDLAVELAAELSSKGLRVELNEPYSGRAGLIYSADRHAKVHARRALEIEVRQDLAVEDVFRRSLVRVLSAFLPGVNARLGA
jgi:predicted N-formylglutamate amidohydrolase